MIYGIIPIVCLYLLFNLKSDKIKALLYSLTIWGSTLYLVAEILSLFDLINKTSLLIIWLTFDLILLFLVIKKKCKFDINISFDKYKILACIVIILLLVFDILIVPYNWDSMTYHLPRIMFWAQNCSVKHFNTYDIRMLTSPVLAEFVNLHNYVLLNTDKFLNLVQGLSFVVLVLLIVCICRTLKLDKKVTYLSVFLFMSMPIALAEALTTQVDLFSSIWALIFVCLSLNLIDKDKIVIKDELFNLIIMGLSLGLGYLSKPSVCLMMLVFGLALLIVRIKHKDGIVVYLLCPIIIGIVALATVSFEIIRNLNTFNALSAPIAGERQLVGTLLPNYLFINFLKNFLFQLGIPFTDRFGTVLYSIVAFFSKLVNVDMNSPLIAEDGMIYTVPAATEINCDTSIAALLCYSLLIVLIACLIKKIKFDTFDKASLISYLSFLVILRWERFESRYLIVFFCMLCIFVSKKLYEIGVSQFIERLYYVATILTFAYFFVLFGHQLKACKGFERPNGYFFANQGIYDSWQSMIDFINENNIKTVSISSSDAYWTYPIFVMGNIEHVECYLGDDMTLKYDKEDYIPEAVVYMGECGEELNYHGNLYKLAYSDGVYHVLLKD